MKTTLLFVLALLVVTTGAAAAQCDPDLYVECGNGACCARSTPVCCPLVCCGSNGRCGDDGASCVPIDDDPPDEPDLPTLPTCDEGMVVALNRCAPGPSSGSDAAVGDDACGCTTTCSTSADCATGCCHQGYCALACVCAGPATVTMNPTPEECEAAGATSVLPPNPPPIGGFGGPGCRVGGDASALFGLAGLLALRRRRRRRHS
ncbi:MAG: hypothetical protein F9K40_16365 [Kofleriaceae bacterium]|nr:MAG: hypothetical protein F9K40_16365 [Kofleriaceae bacterium]MBZ0236784.1 hypothetical protein [Kofleriaceae bacterium]